MQVLIDISEEIYQNVIKNGFIYDEDNEAISHAIITNGILLPKGHGDLIDVNRKITVPIYDEQYEEWGEKTLTVLEALNKWSDEGVTVGDVVIPADKEGEG